MRRLGLALAGGLAKLLLGLVGMTLLVAASLFVLGAWLATLPLLRMGPRERHLKAGLDLVQAVAVALQAFKPDLPPDLLDDEPLDSAADRAGGAGGAR